MLKECTVMEGFTAYASGQAGDTYFADLDQTVVVCGNSPKPHDLDAARRMNYMVQQIPVPGGCVVFQPHDFLIVHLSERADDFFDKWSKYLLAFLREKGLDASCFNLSLKSPEGMVWTAYSLYRHIKSCLFVIRDIYILKVCE